MNIERPREKHGPLEKIHRERVERDAPRAWACLQHDKRRDLLITAAMKLPPKRRPYFLEPGELKRYIEKTYFDSLPAELREVLYLSLEDEGPCFTPQAFAWLRVVT